MCDRESPSPPRTCQKLGNACALILRVSLSCQGSLVQLSVARMPCKHAVAHLKPRYRACLDAPGPQEWPLWANCRGRVNGAVAQLRCLIALVYLVRQYGTGRVNLRGRRRWMNRLRPIVGQEAWSGRCLVAYAGFRVQGRLDALGLAGDMGWRTGGILLTDPVNR